MAEEAYIVAFDIKSAGPGWNIPIKASVGSASEGTVGLQEVEAGGLISAKSGLTDQVATCKLVEVKAGKVAEAIEIAREFYALHGTGNAGAVRAVVKPNTNFKIAI